MVAKIIKKQNNWAPSLKFMASFEVQMNCAFLETSAGFGSCWYFERKVFIFRGHMLRGKIIMGAVNYEREKAPCIIFFITVTPRWISLWYLCGSFHMIANHFSNEASPSCQRRAVLSVTALTSRHPFSLPQLQGTPWEQELAASQPGLFRSIILSLLSQASKGQGLPLPFNLVLQPLLPEAEGGVPAPGLPTCAAPWTAHSTLGEGGMALPNWMTRVPPYSTDSCCCS